MRFTIVTPVYNGEKYIRSAIESVLSQEGDFSIEYIVRDGGSTDKTISIIQEYSDRLSKGDIRPRCKEISISHHSEKDRGMYDAINKGFACGTGDIFAWINADDYYLPGAFQSIARTFQKFPEIQWLKGMTCVLQAQNSSHNIEPKCSPCFVFNQSWIRRGIYGRNAYFIHQDSVFWKRELWEKAGPIDTSLKNAGDYWLWVHFAQHTPLYSLNRPVSVFRKLPDSLTERNGTRYRDEQQSIISPRGDALEFRIKLFFWLKNKLHIEGVFEILYPLLFKREQKDYIDMAPDGTPIKKSTRSYIAHP